MIKYGWKEVTEIMTVVTPNPTLGILIDKENNIYQSGAYSLKVFGIETIYSVDDVYPIIKYKIAYCGVERVETKENNNFNKNINYKYPKQFKRLHKMGRN